MAQALAWESHGRFAPFCDANTGFSRTASGTPELTLSVGKRYSLPGSGRRSAVIIEIEIGNRSINMRQEFLPYFTDPTLLAVVGVSFFGSDVCPAQRAVAVKWVLTNRGIEVAVVMDFGVDPISTNAMQVFAQDVAGVADEMLPGVRPDLWAHNRHVPLTVAAFDPAPEALTPDLCAQYIYNQNNDRNLYATSTVPIITFPGSELQSVLHNLPDEAEALDDFNLNLANVFFWVMKGAEYTE